MAIQSVELAALPARTRELTADDRQLAADVAAAAVDGKFATDGVVHPDKAKANAAVSKIKRLMSAANTIPAGQVAKTAVRTNGKGYSWYLSLVAAPAEPRRRNRKPKGDA